MQVTTTTRDGKPVTAETTKKPWAWSYSKLKNFEVCPRRHYEIDIAKSVKEEESEDLKWGGMLHKAAAARLDPSKRTPLPAAMAKMLEPWCERVEKGPGTILVEQQLAIGADFGPTPWFTKPWEKPAWFRSIADVLKINGPVALALDWKTGKIKEDGVQLALMSAVIFAHFPDIQKIRTEFIWLQFDANTRADFARSDMPAMWKANWPRIEALKHAHDTQTYPEKPGGLCKRWCPVTGCQHHGE